MKTRFYYGCDSAKTATVKLVYFNGIDRTIYCDDLDTASDVLNADVASNADFSYELYTKSIFSERPIENIPWDLTECNSADYVRAFRKCVAC